MKQHLHQTNPKLMEAFGNIKLPLAASLVLLFMPLQAANAQGTSPQADPPVFSNEVVRILQQNCQRCHQPGGIAPMPLETYEQASVWAPLIRENVLRRVMPPWHLDPTIGIQEYKNDFSLKDDDLDTLVAWVDAGAPEGDRANLPGPVDWPNWQEWELEPELGAPDMIFETGPIPIRARGEISGRTSTWNGPNSLSRVF